MAGLGENHFGAQTGQSLAVQFMPTYNAVFAAFRLKKAVQYLCSAIAIVCFS